MTTLRLHMPAIPHTLTRPEYSHCAYTGKVLRFAAMMQSRGFEVYHYGVESSMSGATKDIQLMTLVEWQDLRVQSYKFLNPTWTEEQIRAKIHNPITYVQDLANFDTPIHVEFNKRLRAELMKHYRSMATDLFCIPMYPCKAIDGLPVISVESGIGYGNSASNYRIFESYAWLHAHEKQRGKNYWFVVPNYFDSSEWTLNLTPKVNTVGFLGRIYDGKGCHEIVEMARKFPTTRFVLCGQGDPTRYLVAPNIFYKPPIHGTERSDYLGSLVACVAPSVFVEPFCGVAVEAQLCGTPVITKDYGAQTETVENFKTGLRCHTLADYGHGIQLALDGKFDRAYIRERAVRLYDMYNVARQYEYTFKTIMDVHNGKNGWYSPTTHIACLKDRSPRVFSILPYFGKFPNYFQLYLDSVGRNNSCLTILLLTDIDLSVYKLPTNVIPISITLQQIRERVSTFLLDTYKVHVEPKNLLLTPYKLIDVKILYSTLFHDLLVKQDVRSTDYVGWGDCDLIYGNLSHFLDFTKTYDVVGGKYGHFTAVRNDPALISLYKLIPEVPKTLMDNSMYYSTDETSFCRLINTGSYTVYPIHDSICDIIPSIYFNRFRPDHATRSTNFFNHLQPSKNIQSIHCTSDSIITTYDDNTSYETAYCHIQKRAMTYDGSSYTSFYITETGFTAVAEV